MLTLFVAMLLASLVYAGALQNVLFDGNGTGTHPRLATHAPATNISSLHMSLVDLGTKYTALSHPSYPDHSVRIKKSDFCDPTVK